MTAPRLHRGPKLGKPSTLIQKVAGPLPTPCWLWLAEVHRTRGYGSIYRFGQKFETHVYFYLCRFGEIPDGMVLDHVCENRRCCNPLHMEVVTAAENCRRGRNAKITWDDVAKIKERRTAGDTCKSIGLAFGISEAAVSMIVRGKRWNENDKPHHRGKV